MMMTTNKVEDTSCPEENFSQTKCSIGFIDNPTKNIYNNQPYSLDSPKRQLLPDRITHSKMCSS